jgi:hypothetical protein
VAKSANLTFRKALSKNEFMYDCRFGVWAPVFIVFKKDVLI